MNAWTRDRDVELLHAADVAAVIRWIILVTFFLVLTALVVLAAVKGHDDRCERLRDQPARYEQLCGTAVGR